MLQHLWWSFSFFHFSDHFYQISCGKSAREGALNTYSLQQQAQHPRTVNNLGTGRLRTNWHFPPLTTSLISSLSNSPGSALFLPTWSSEGLCKMLFSLPGVPRQSGRSMLNSTTTKTCVSHTPGFSHAIWHPPPCTAYPSACINE